MMFEDPVVHTKKVTSRKFILTIATGLILLATWLATGVFESLALAYNEFTMAILSLLGMYFTGNIVNKRVVGTALSKIQPRAGTPDGLD